MTIEEMDHKIESYCNERFCSNCKLNQLGIDCKNFDTKAAYLLIFGSDTETTDADQSIKADAGKARLTLVPQKILWDIAEVRAYGLKKYGSAENWKKVEIERYKDAAFRHFLKYLSNPQGVDEESGISHLKHLACNIAFLCELEKGGENNE